jgi:hypothetical protein
MRFPFLLAGLIVVLGTTAASTPAEALKIDHRSVGCATNGLNPAFTVRLTPTEAVDEARLYFEGEGTYMPYYVLLEKDGDLSGPTCRPSERFRSSTGSGFGRTPAASRKRHA